MRLYYKSSTLQQPHRTGQHRLDYLALQLLIFQISGKGIGCIGVQFCQLSCSLAYALDELLIDGLNILDANISPRTGVNLAVFVFDHEADGVTDLTKGEVSPFNLITFLTGADVSISASPDGSGVISVELVTRGGTETEMNIPNWPSATNRISVMFNDDTQ